MVDIKTPQIILDTEKLSRLSPKERAKYTYSVISEVVKLNSHGVTITSIAKFVPFSRPVISGHLDKMLAKNEIYMVNIGQNKVYYPNSRAMHPISTSEVSVGNRVYSTFLVDNPFGKFLYVQEKKKQDFSMDVMGGILIPIKAIPKFMKLLDDSVKEMEKKEYESGD